MTLIKQEKLVSVLVILYIPEYLCFTKLFTGHPGIQRFPISGISGSRNNQKHSRSTSSVNFLRKCEYKKIKSEMYY